MNAHSDKSTESDGVEGALAKNRNGSISVKEPTRTRAETQPEVHPPAPGEITVDQSRLIRHRRIVVAAAHLLLLPVAYFVAFWIRFDGEIPGVYLHLFFVTLPAVVAIRALFILLFNLHHGWWRYVSTSDLRSIVLAVTLSSVVYAVVLRTLPLDPRVPMGVILLDWICTIGVLGGARLGVRMMREGLSHRAHRRAGTLAEPVLVIGAGDAAEQLIRELGRDPAAAFRPVAMLDDDPAKLGMRIRGVPVVGHSGELEHFAAAHDAKQAIVAIPSISDVELQAIVKRGREAGVRCHAVPTLRDLFTGRAKLTELREVQIEDLLGRGAVELDLTQMHESLGDTTVLITGGAGSIGSELARQVAALAPRRLVLLDQAESPLYFIHLEIAHAHPALEVVPVICDVANKDSLAKVFAEHRPQHVFHAAAYKHVPLMEANVAEAVRNNVLGTLQVAELAAECSAERFVLISTDKAVRPSSVMGATKRIAERIVLGWPSLRRSTTDFRAVRFGNVLGSNGSVIPLFRQQLAHGGPLTVTHKDVTRYFMTIPEAVQLVLTAGTLPEAAGHICMLEMGEPVKIIDLAENLIRLSGLEPHVDVAIKVTGLRPGEKLYEELMGAVETTVPTRVKKIRVVQSEETETEKLETAVIQLLVAKTLDHREELLTCIRRLVPEAVAPLSAPPIGETVDEIANANLMPYRSRLSPLELK